MYKPNNALDPAEMKNFRIQFLFAVIIFIIITVFFPHKFVFHSIFLNIYYYYFFVFYFVIYFVFKQYGSKKLNKRINKKKMCAWGSFYFPQIIHIRSFHFLLLFLNILRKECFRFSVLLWNFIVDINSYDSMTFAC